MRSDKKRRCNGTIGGSTQKGNWKRRRPAAVMVLNFEDSGSMHFHLLEFGSGSHGVHFMCCC